MPGAGKANFSRTLARDLGAVYLRIDSVEQAMRSAGAQCIGPAGYAVANALSESNFRLGLFMLADCVNPVRESRVAWADVAKRAPATLVNIHLTCSDAAEHRRRSEGRSADIPDFILPTWEDITRRNFDLFEDDCLSLDTVVLSVEEALIYSHAYITDRLGNR